MTYHVTPINDIEEHIEDSACGCKPRIIEVNGELVIVHHSFDRREYIEKLKETYEN